MRIIAGFARGRKLCAPKGLGTRPTPDRVREALFSMLAQSVVDAHILDLFAGSGALGLEALSRGAAHATFVDSAPDAIACLTSNVAVLKELVGRATIVRSDAFTAVETLGRQAQKTFDLIFMDPPYALDLVADVLAALRRARILAPGAIVVADHAKGQIVPTDTCGFVLKRQRTFGNVALAIWQEAYVEDGPRADGADA